MNDGDVMQHINALMEEEHELLKAAEHGGLDEEQHERLGQVKVSLDQFWDLLRQRRAHREFGQNPDEATIRDPNIVEGYKG